MSNASTAVPADLPSVDRETVEHLWHRPDGLPRIDWHLANHWIDSQRVIGGAASALRRGIMAACLDELRDSLPCDHRRWRSRHVLGLAPLEGAIGPALAATGERRYKVLHADMRAVRGDEPIPPIAVVAIEPQRAYIDFTMSYFPDEGAIATSGGLYLHEGGQVFPLIAICAATRFGCEAAFAHELTHHALHGCGLPLWVEEGFTQMREERIAHAQNFQLNAEMVDRQREHWDNKGIKSFLDGSAFLSPREDTQELAYHLAQWVVRGQLTHRPTVFFRFARACREANPDVKAREILGTSLRETVLQTIGIED